jgi:hypothetical protein
MSSIFKLPLARAWAVFLGVMSMVITLLLADPSASETIAKAKPKFFICPPGMVRDATAITETYQVNLCSKQNAEISIVAMRNTKTKQQMNLPISTKDDIIYTAQSKSYTYQFDFNKGTLTIKSANGKKTVERILSSD